MNIKTFQKIVDKNNWVPWVVFHYWRPDILKTLLKSAEALGNALSSNQIGNIKYIRFHSASDLDLKTMPVTQTVQKDLKEISESLFEVTEVQVRYIILYHTIDHIGNDFTGKNTEGLMIGDDQTIEDGINSIAESEKSLRRQCLKKGLDPLKVRLRIDTVMKETLSTYKIRTQKKGMDMIMDFARAHEAGFSSCGTQWRYDMYVFGKPPNTLRRPAGRHG